MSADISSLESQVQLSVRRMDCLLAGLGLHTSQAGLDYTALWSGLESDVGDPNLRETLRTGLEQCGQSVQCLHQTEQQHARVITKKALDFLKCFESKKTEACVKKSIKKKLLEKLRWLTYLEP